MEENIQEGEIENKTEGDVVEKESFCKCERYYGKKMKNLISALILIGGLFAGSLFVDLSHLIKGGGFSEKNLRKTDIFQADNKTWVAYNEPMVDVKVISDDNCLECDPSEALVWLRRVSPTISAEKINFDSEEGKRLIEKFSLKTLPAFIFSEAVAKTEFFVQAQSIFAQRDNQFELKTQELGLTPGKYLETPKVSENDAVFGNREAKVKIVIFTDFQCPYCKALHQSMRETMEQYADRVLFVHKDLPLEFHAQANGAALAASCALEQNKFWEYADRLFAEQVKWQDTAGTQNFKNYARDLKLNTQQFNQCLDSRKYQDKIDNDKAEAGQFGIAGTPAVFINDKFINGVVSQDDLKKTIDDVLAR